MLNSGGKKYSNSRVVRIFFFGTKQTPPPPPPPQVKWSVPNHCYCSKVPDF